MARCSDAIVEAGGRARRLCVWGPGGCLGRSTQGAMFCVSAGLGDGRGSALGDCGEIRGGVVEIRGRAKHRSFGVDISNEGTRST